jgi:hypothetical protein
MAFPIEILERFQDTAVSTAIRETTWLFPSIETVHVLALTLLVGTIAIFDLRLLGWASQRRAVTRLAKEVLPWTWGSFVVAVVSGTLLFVSKAVHYYGNVAFRIKLGFLLLAGINVLLFETVTLRSVARWDRSIPTPPAAQRAGTLSLVFWIGVVVAGRWIGFLLR